MKRSLVLVVIAAAALAAPAFAANPIANSTYVAFCSNPVCSLALHVSANGKSALLYSASIGTCSVKVTGTKPMPISSGKIAYDGNVPSVVKGRTLHLTLSAKWSSSRQVKGTFKLTGKGCSGRTASFTGGLGQG